MQRLTFWTGASIGALLTACALSVSFVAHHLAGLPFVAFDLFDWMARHLPGGLLTAGIDAMVAAIGALGLGPTAEVAKQAEQATAIVGFVGVGAVAGGVLFVVLGRSRGRYARAAGLVLGAVAAVPLLAVTLQVRGPAAAPAALQVLWTFALSLAWGAALGWSYDRLARTRTELGPPVSARDTAAQVEAEALDRRTFLVKLGTATAVMTVTGAVVGRLSSRRGVRDEALAAGAQPWSASHQLPNASAAVQPVRGTRPELTPVPRHYRIDISTRPPRVNADAWRLRVGGLVERPRAFTLAELRRFEPMHQFVTLECISNRVAGDLISTTRWTGVSLQHLLGELGLRPEATHLRIRSADGFHEVVALETIRGDPRVMLCYDWDGLPLPEEHGFPLRIYIPDRFGMKQPKWIQSIEAIAAWEPGYWVQRGWDREARVQATSVIDTVATDMMLPPHGRPADMTIPVGGIAYAGARAISRVQVRVDDGAWQDAVLREPLSGTTWVMWRYDWPFRAGKHTLAVRCVDGTGALQVAEPSPPHPAGATGIHRMDVML